ncbi:MAG: hypothetical protein A2020_13550 [Lentisphaerae bacterium GWF2_45_14]|nr:MAG: hypothetical protein A2020_13550 [Lentisphaerae bacterium GWF2_45_14]
MNRGAKIIEGSSFEEIIRGREMLSDNEFLYLLRDTGTSCSVKAQAIYRKLLDDPAMLECYDYVSSTVVESFV